jgi:hypothetical protein
MDADKPTIPPGDASAGVRGADASFTAPTRALFLVETRTRWVSD